MLESLGCLLVQADVLGHKVLEPDGPAFQPVVEQFGSAILHDGRIDRKALGQIVFADEEKLKKLNAIVHPLVFALEEQAMDSWERDHPQGIAIVEAAIMIEAGSYRRYRKLILAVCPEAEQIARAMKRDGLTEAEARQRLERQMPLSQKYEYADYIIDTAGSMDKTQRQTRAVFESLRSFAA